MICPDCRSGYHGKCPEVRRRKVFSERLDPVDVIVSKGSQWCDCAHKSEGVNVEALRLERIANGTEAEATGGDTL